MAMSSGTREGSLTSHGKEIKNSLKRTGNSLTRVVLMPSRPYSAVTTTKCVIGALSWHQWQRIERAQHEAEVRNDGMFSACYSGSHFIKFSSTFSESELLVS